MKKFIMVLILTLSLAPVLTAGVAKAQVIESFVSETAGPEDAKALEKSPGSYYTGKEKYFKIFTKANKKTRGVDFYASNSGYCTYQFEVAFTELTNAKTTVPMPYYGVIGASRQNVLLFGLAPESKGKYKYRYKFKFHIGDPDSARHDDSYKYVIPFEKGTGRKVQQGYGGAFSHDGWMKYSIDFPVPVGTKVCAARDGIVALIKSDSNTAGKTRQFMQYGNYIVIAHNDGTFAEYVHLKQGGNIVSAGDRVAAGDVIGLSGNTGFSTSPHLHFMVVKPERIGLWSIPVKFLGEGGSAIELLQGNKYVVYR